MPVSVHDARSNSNEQIVHAANIIGRSRRCYDVFKAIYKGKKNLKTVKDIEEITNLNNVEVLQQGRKLSSNGIVEQTKTKAGTGYKKDKFYSQHYRKILSIAGKKEKIGKIPTKRNSGNTINITNKATIKKFVNIVQITVDDIDNFRKVKSIDNKSVRIKSIYERPFKEGIKKIIGETGKFVDWGGEKNDLFTTRLKIKGKRYNCAFAFKGKGKTGILIPRKMGKNGDQIQRLFNSHADVFIVQYWENIDESIVEQMKFFAQAKSAIEKKKIYFGIIDGIDSQRIIKAYNANFSNL